jgi:7-carboxy-7-deazaguanine synthase (Cx14CxxC type)
MGYSVKEIFYTLQGEGAQSGRPAVFCRFSGCNLWSGRESDRRTAVCQFCDTDFIGTDGPGGGFFPMATDLAHSVAVRWPGTRRGLVRPFVVCTGGEPLLQLDEAAVDAFHDQGFEVAIETNGTRVPPHGVDWICCSPKSGSELVIQSGHELKFVFPQPSLCPTVFETLDFRYFFLQPMDGGDYNINLKMATSFCLENPRWRLSLQTHKILGIP